MSLYPSIETYIQSLPSTFERISPDRKELLEQLAGFIREKEQNEAIASLIFICTHNSRRSHFGQVWAQALAAYHGMGRLNSFSGGTEATAFNPHAIRALREVGFEISELQPGDNPHYAVKFGDANTAVTEAWSKKYDDPANPQSDFCAVMTCSEADEACPLVLGASARIPLTYEDPKIGDGTPQEAEGYRTRCRQIASELHYMFTQV